MSLFESGESNGSVSLASLFGNQDSFDGNASNLSLDELIFAICRSSWLASLSRKAGRTKLIIAQDLFRQTCDVDISSIDEVKRNSNTARAVLRSYARNICILAEAKTIAGDVHAIQKADDDTTRDYIRAPERLYIVDDIEAWCSAVRSRPPFAPRGSAIWSTLRS